MALVLLATVSYHCAATWRWLRGLGRDGDGDAEDALAKQAAIRISHSLPDLKTEPIRHEYIQDPKDGKKVNPVKYLFSVRRQALETPLRAGPTAGSGASRLWELRLQLPLALRAAPGTGPFPGLLAEQAGLDRLGKEPV
jgi:hypothetical protein